MVETPYETERETEREDEDNHGGDDETKNTGQPAQHKLIKLAAFWTELTSQYPRYSKLARKILNVIKLITSDFKRLTYILAAHHPPLIQTT